MHWWLNTKAVNTGVTGAVGGAVARLVTQKGTPVRLLLRDPAKLPALGEVDGDTEVARADYSAADVGEALRGIRVLFMVSARESADRVDQHRHVIDAAVRAGVEHIVYTSFLGASPTSTFTLGREHHATEAYLEASPVASTILRNSFYGEIFESFAGRNRVISGPGGDGRLAPVARADVARVVAAVLTEPSQHVGRTYTLTGPRALSLSEIAETLAAVRGTPFSYRCESVEEAHASRSSGGVPDWQVEAWVSTYTAIASGELDVVTHDVLDVTGQHATSFEELLESSAPPVF